jgi:SAM-dependent methyltransferase
MASVAIPRYHLKSSPFSSHSLLLTALPERGQGRRVLDVGCADGYLGELLAARGYHVTGIDSPGAARRGFPASIDFVEADLDRGLPSLPGRFDIVLCADVLEHLREPAAMLRQLRDVLSPAGCLLASLPNSGHAYFRWQVLRGRFPQHDRGLFDRTHLHFYTWEGWRDLFASTGFRIRTLACSGVPAGLALPKWDGTAIVRALERLSFESARLWKGMFAYQFIVTAYPEELP